MNIRISQDLSTLSSYYNIFFDTLYLRLEKEDYEALTDDELIKYIADIIVHETMHSVINKLFDSYIITCMYDTVEHNFRQYPDITTPNYKRYNWKRTIKEKGLKRLLDNYLLTKDKLKDAFKKAEIRKEVII